MDEIDISNPGSLQGGGFTDPWRVLRLILAQAVALSSCAIAFFRTHESIAIRAETEGCWYEWLAPPPQMADPLWRVLRERTGIPVDAGWGEG